MRDRFRRTVGGFGPLEPTAFQPAVIHPEPVVIPAQKLEFIAVFVAEDEPGLAEGVRIERQLHQARQAEKYAESIANLTVGK